VLEACACKRREGVSSLTGDPRGIKSSSTAPRSTSHASLFSAQQKEESFCSGFVNKIENCEQSKSSLFLVSSPEFLLSSVGTEKLDLHQGVAAPFLWLSAAPG